MLIPVILSGGSGTRLWPVSRSLFPKQLHNLTGGGSLLQNTVNRLASLPGLGGCVVVCNQHHRVPVLAQLADAKVPTDSLILENTGRNTAPAVAVAALQCQRQDEDAIMVVLSADHTIEQVADFQSAISQAAQLAAKGLLVTFGIVAHEPHTGFGYIQRAATPLSDDANAYSVSGFVEKPDAKTAAQYVASGDYYWNSGMFVFRAATFLAELGEHRPDILSACENAVNAAQVTSEAVSILQLGDAFTQVPSESIDYAVMEKTTRAAVVPVDIGWSDVGSWLGLWEVSEHDSAGNSASGDVVLHDVKNSLVRAGHRLVTVAGLSDIAVVDTEDALLVTSMSHSEGIKEIVKVLQNDQRPELQAHQTTQTLWGQRQVLCASATCHVAKLTLMPGMDTGVLHSAQTNSILTMVSGDAQVTVNNDTQSLAAGDSVQVNANDALQLKNTSKMPIELIEVQTGGESADGTA